jgi:hypothetical protein
MEGLVLTGLASRRGQAKLTVRGLPPTMAAMTGIMAALADEGISVDMMTHADRRRRPAPAPADHPRVRPGKRRGAVPQRTRAEGGERWTCSGA